MSHEPALRDIANRDDLLLILETFYTKAFRDPKIGRFFTEVVPLDLRAHIPVIADFWQAILFNEHTYKKNVMEVHQNINRLSSIRKEHLDQWLRLFTATVDSLFEGNRATLMKHRATSIAMLMDMKLNHPMHKKANG